LGEFTEINKKLFSKLSIISVANVFLASEDEDRYNADMDERKYLPDSNRVGLLTSTVLLAFALTRIIQAPGFDVELQLPGFLLTLPLNISTAMSLLTAGLTATGMDWLLRGHPSLNGRNTIEWWVLPTLTAFVISVPLTVLPDGAAWWIGFALTGTFLFFVFLAEYIVVDPGAPFYATSMAGLTAISYTLFFILAVAVRYSDARLFLVAPGLFIATTLASLRIMHLRLSGRWEFAWALGIAFICVQIASGLHYWPLSPVQFGLMLTGPLYALTNLAINLSEDLPTRRAALEPAIVTALCWGLAIFIR
jgi:ABC-type multidrug transport system fused ATPase/permease subunit